MLSVMDPMERKIKLKPLNPFITCQICKGYLIDATTVTECLHTCTYIITLSWFSRPSSFNVQFSFTQNVNYCVVCKSCLVKHLEEKNTCPKCELVIHQSHPLQYISHDRTLQDVVYKLVPNLQESKFAAYLTTLANRWFILGEEKRQREFYQSRGLPYPKAILEKSLKDSNPNIAETIDSFNWHKEDEQIGIELHPIADKNLKHITGKFIRCSSQATITHVKKFISSQIFKSKDRQKDIDVFYNEELLGKDHTLKFVFVTRWRVKVRFYITCIYKL